MSPQSLARRLTFLASVSALLAAPAMFALHAQSPASASGAQASSWTPPRTPWGDPDVQGTWNYGTMTPLERPAQWAGREVLSEEEARAYQDQTVVRRAGANNTAGPDWWEPENNVLRNRRTSLIVDPPDGRLPPAAEPAGARGRGGRGAPAAGGRGRGGQYDNPENLSLQDRCITWPAAGPPMMPTVYNNNVLIVQTPTHVVLVNEMIHSVRIVPMDGSPHSTERTIYGDARGRWDGTTLVIDTINFDGRLNFRGTGDRLHLVERFTRTSDKTLEYRYTAEDSQTWSRPWTARIDMSATEGLMFEFACHEGNERSVSGILSGARYLERNPPQQNRQ